MGVCASCLGLGRRSSQSEPSDTSQLLGDPYQPQYGSINGSGPQGIQPPDPEEIRRQRNALERICNETSSKLIDVSRSVYSEEGSKLAGEFPRLFSERFPSTRPITDRPHSVDNIGEEEEAVWLARILGESGTEEGSWDRVEPVGSGKLTIQFDDALGPERRTNTGR